MNRFTNNCVLGISVMLLAAACQPAAPTAANTPAKEQPTATPVQEIAPAAQKAVAPAPKETPVKKAAPKAYVPSPDEAIARLKQWDNDLRFLQTRFVQTTRYDGVTVSRSQGTLFYDKNRQLLRLDTQDEDGTVTQSALTDKKDILILDDAARPVTRLTWQEWQQSQPNQALFDFGHYTALLERHNVRAVRPNYVALTPKEGEEYTLYLTLSPQDYFPTAITITAGDLTTQADLQHIQKNKPLPENTFGGFVK